MAGQVRAKGEARRTRSDFMQMEKDRGISVSASAMSFDYDGFRFNLVDTPGHSDFSEDTYRTLTAVDAAVMVIDGAKGVESQTRKLFEVCRLRDLPILTFCNKMDRESREPFEIVDEIQEALAIDVTPASWPIGTGAGLPGHLRPPARPSPHHGPRRSQPAWPRAWRSTGSTTPAMADHVPDALLGKLREEVEMARELMPPLDTQALLDGTLTPIWFGSAINSFGVRELMEGIGRYGPEPQPQSARAAPDRARRVLGRGLRVQGPGQHGPAPPRPRGLRAPRVGPLPARHEADACPREEADGGDGAGASSSPPIARSRRRPGRATSSASPTTASFASATR